MEKRGFLIKKRRKRGIQFRPKKTKTHWHNSTINPTKLVRYQYRLNMTSKSKKETKLPVVHRDFCAIAYVCIRKRENTRKIVHSICVACDYNITLSD